jgi:hypothetical protein
VEKGLKVCYHFERCRKIWESEGHLVEVGSDPVGPGSSSSDAAGIASIRTVQAPEVMICLIGGAVGAGAAERNILNGSS